VHSNLFTKICNIVNNTTLAVTPKFKNDFLKEYNPKTYSSKENYSKSVLEFILKKNGIATQKNYQHDTIFNFASEILIDWKAISEVYGTAVITTTTQTGLSTKKYDSTHYGFVNYYGDPFKVGDVLKFELVELIDKDFVWNNPCRVFEKYFTYKPRHGIIYTHDKRD
jgi:hypothetical protein